MKILWFHSVPGEVEHDVYISCKQYNIDITIYAVNYVNPPYPYIGISADEVGKIINSNPADLYVLRYPDGLSMPESQNKVLCWTSEQGPTRENAETSTRPYRNIGYNNKQELDFYKSTGKRLFYLPFCGREIDTNYNNTIYDIVTTPGAPHYNCNCCNGLRRKSVETMILPLVQNNYNIGIYGMAETEHGWNQVPNLGDKYKGGFKWEDYYKIAQLGKLNVEITWNWSDGGYGCKLGRLLGAGVPIIWHKTIGMELDGFEKGNQIDWSSSPEETIQLVDYYLSHDKERIEMAKRGHEWFKNNWVWAKNLERIANEI